MTDIFNALLPIFLIILLGAALRRIQLVPRDMWLGFERIAYWVLFPALLIETLSTADMARVQVTGIALTLFFAVSTMCLLVWAAKPLLTRAFALDGPAYTSVVQASTRWNGFIALAIVARMFGDDGLTLIAVALATMVPLLNLFNVVILALYAAEEPPTPLTLVKAVARNPFIWACAVGIAINLLEIPVYEPLLTMADILGRSALGAGLLLVGGGLIIRDALKPRPVVVAAAVLKLMAMPLIVSGYGVLFGLEGFAWTTALVCGAVPTAMNGYVLARQMGGDAPLLAAIATVQTAISFVSLPIVIALAS